MLSVTRKRPQYPLTGNMHTATNIGELNRAASIIGGVAVFLAGAKGGFIRRTLLMPFGVELVRRGVTGHCYLSQKLDKERSRQQEDDQVDLMSEQSFPASDPPAH